MYDVTGTLLIVIEYACMCFPLVLGSYCTFSLMKIPDLSMEAAYVCGSIIGARTLILTNHWPLALCFPTVILASIIGGMLVGLTSSLLTHKAKFPHLLSSILTSGVFHGMNQFFLGTSNVSLNHKRNLMGLLAPIGDHVEALSFIRRHPELPEFIIAFILLAILGRYFFRTQLGTSLAVYGNNPRFFENYGISTQFVFICGVLLSNGLAGMAGFFDAQSSGFVDINMGAMRALFCITSIILGKTLVSPRKPYSIWVSIVGSFTYFIIIQLLLKVHFNLKYFTMVQSLIVASILIVKYQKSRTRTNHLGV